MPSRRNYRLIATTGLDAKGLCTFFDLFKIRQINILKLVLLRRPDEKCGEVCRLEVLFSVPDEEELFLNELDGHLSHDGWLEKVLVPL